MNSYFNAYFQKGVNDLKKSKVLQIVSLLLQNNPHINLKMPLNEEIISFKSKIHAYSLWIGNELLYAYYLL